MLKQFPVRAFFGALALICLALLTTAWYAQHGPQHQQPCPLCILQRYAYIGIGLVSLAGAVHGPRRIGAVVYAVLADLFAFCGLALATWQVSKGHTMKSCMEDPIGTFVNGLPSSDWWPEYFFATGGCGDVYPPLLGLTVPLWSLVWFATFALAIATYAFATLKKK